jgi:RNA polymerase sigma-70 factor (ECF subfamily)
MSFSKEHIAKVLMQQRDRLSAQVWVIVGDFHITEDVLQELTVLAIEKGVEFEDEFRLRAWLRKSARLKALEAVRRQGRVPVLLSSDVLEQLDVAWETAEESPIASTLERLSKCMDELTPRNRQILNLRYAQGKKTAEVATILGRNVDAVYKAIVRIHVALRDCIEAKVAEDRV